MKLELKSAPRKINMEDVLKKTTDSISRREVLAVFLIFLVFVGYVGYLWYRYAYDYRWSEAKKQEYVSSKNEMNNFNKAKFEKVLKDMDVRQEFYQKNIEGVRDIFRLKQ